MRVNNYNIVSKGHTNMTVKQNKLALSPFDSKRFLLFDEISTVPFGHKAAEENAFLEDIYMDTEWANSYNETDNSSPDFTFPDWGFLQRPYSEAELQKKKKLLVAESVNVPLQKTHLFYLKLQKNEHLKNSAKKTKTINIKF